MGNTEIAKLRAIINDMQSSNSSIKAKIDEINNNVKKLLETKEIESKQNKKENNLFKLCFCT